MNENRNRVPKALPEDVFNKIMDHVGMIDELLKPYMVGLTPDERMALPKINVDNRDFVNDTIKQMALPESAEIIPGFLKPKDAIEDITMFDQMETIGMGVEAIGKKVDATRILAGSEGYTTVLLFKRLVESAEIAGMPGAAGIANRLRDRFRANASAATETPETNKVGK